MDASQLKVEKRFDMQSRRMDSLQVRLEHEMRKTEQSMTDIHSMNVDVDQCRKTGTAMLEEGLADTDKRLRSLEFGGSVSVKCNHAKYVNEENAVSKE